MAGQTAIRVTLVGRARFMSMTRRFIRLMNHLVILGVVSCGLLPERVSANDSRLKPMFDAIAKVDRAAMGFTPIATDATIRVEWRPRAGYDAMLHIDGRTSRTVAFKRTANGYEWIGEQEIFTGPKTYKSVDGEFSEQITITFDRVRISGFPTNRVSVTYSGDEPTLSGVRELTLQDAEQWLKKWGYR
jgi:hypothetical protein